VLARFLGISKEEVSMRKLILPIVAAATLLGTAAASAQSIEFNTGPRAYYHDRDWRAYHDGRDRDVVVIRKHRHDWDRDRYYENRGPGFSFRTY
jgi:Ni/Co efflux regulator RcnB